MPEATPTASAPRYRALDGLRGFAAVSVALFHACLTIPALAGAFLVRPQRPHGLGWALTYTPLRLFWAGGEAVYLFFVLSGFVLVLPLATRAASAGARPFSWRAYYPRRLIRLYLPIWGALVVTVALVAAVPRTTTPGASWWVHKHDLPTTAATVGRDAAALLGFDDMNSALWSLQYEILFSLGLPVYAWFCLRVLPRRLLVPKLVTTAAIAALGEWTAHQALTVAAVFLLGALLAAHHAQVHHWSATRSTRAGAVLAVLGCLGMIVGWLASAPGQPPRSVAVAGFGVQLLATTLLVVLFLAWRPAVRLGTSTVGRWLGTRSFSLYLIHEPIVVSAALLLGPEQVRWTPLVGVAVALVAADVFYRVVEGPSHRLSQRVGRAFRAPHVAAHAARPAARSATA